MNKETLHKAIDLAEGQGQCKYIGRKLNGEIGPRCVIAHLYTLEGGDPNDLIQIEGFHIAGDISPGMPSGDDLKRVQAFLVQKGYDVEYLREIQKYWDIPAIDVEAARRAMHSYAEAEDPR